MATIQRKVYRYRTPKTRDTAMVPSTVTTASTALSDVSDGEVRRRATTTATVAQAASSRRPGRADPVISSPPKTQAPTGLADWSTASTALAAPMGSSLGSEKFAMSLLTLLGSLVATS